MAIRLRSSYLAIIPRRKGCLRKRKVGLRWASRVLWAATDFAERGSRLLSRKTSEPGVPPVSFLKTVPKWCRLEKPHFLRHGLDAMLPGAKKFGGELDATPQNVLGRRGI